MLPLNRSEAAKKPISASQAHNTIVGLKRSRTHDVKPRTLGASTSRLHLTYGAQIVCGPEDSGRLIAHER